MSQRGKLAVEVVFVHPVYVGLEVEAWDDLVGSEEDANWVVNGSTSMVER